MDINARKRDVILGIFIFVGVLIFTATILTLGGQRKSFSKSFSIKAYFDDVNGLKPGGGIWFSGVKVGVVKNVMFAATNKVEVELSIENASSEFIRKNAKAKIGSDGLIGNRIVVIYGGDNSAAAVEPNDVIEAEKEAGMDEIMNTLKDNNDNILSITSDLKVVTSRLAKGEGTLGLLSADNAIADNLLATMESVRKTSTQLQQISSNIAQFSSELNKPGNLANQLVTDKELFNNLKKTTASLQEVSESAAKLMANLNMQSKNTEAPVGLLLNDAATANQLRETMKNLEAGSKKLDENMEALQHTFPFKRYFKKKNKAAGLNQ